MRSEDFDVNKLVENLQGSCQSRAEAVANIFEGMEDDDLTEDDTEAIDAEIFQCDTCGWWHEAHEQDDDGNCEGCSTIENDEEDD